MIQGSTKKIEAGDEYFKPYSQYFRTHKGALVNYINPTVRDVLLLPINLPAGHAFFKIHRSYQRRLRHLGLVLKHAAFPKPTRGQKKLLR